MEKLVAAPRPAHRLVPSRFPPIGLFDTVATAADAAAVMELAGWTNDRLVAERIDRLPRDQWVYGRANASIVMASFLHVAPGGMRFNGPDLGAWYAAASIVTAAAEVGHHLRREAVARSVKGMRRTYRNYTAALIGDYRDIRGWRRGFFTTACAIAADATSSPTDRSASPRSCRRSISKSASRRPRAGSRFAS